MSEGESYAGLTPAEWKNLDLSRVILDNAARMIYKHRVGRCDDGYLERDELINEFWSGALPRLQRIHTKNLDAVGAARDRIIYGTLHAYRQTEFRKREMQILPYHQTSEYIDPVRVNSGPKAEEDCVGDGLGRQMLDYLTGQREAPSAHMGYLHAAEMRTDFTSCERIDTMAYPELLTEHRSTIAEEMGSVFRVEHLRGKLTTSEYEVLRHAVHIDCTRTISEATGMSTRNVNRIRRSLKDRLEMMAEDVQAGRLPVYG